MVELADTLDSGSSGGNSVQVQVLFSAPFPIKIRFFQLKRGEFMKKILFVVWIFILVFVFAGCGSDDEDEAQTLPDEENVVTDNGNTVPDIDSSGSAEEPDGSAANDQDAVTPVPDSESETPDNDMPPVTTNCNPGMKVCDASDPTSVFKCKDDGSGVEIPAVEKCGEGLVCALGKCETSVCASAGASYLGCDFYTAKLYNGRKNEKITSKESFSVAIANSHPEQTATIEFFKTLDNGSETKIESFEYCYKVTKSSIFGDYDDMKCENHDSSFVITVKPQETIVVTPKKEDRMLIGTAASFLSYHIKSDFPVILYQFNPFYNLSSNDASLVLPSTKLGADYIVSSYQDETNVDGDGPGYFTIIGAYDMPVELEITPTADIAPAGKIPGTMKGEPMTVEINQGEVLNIVTTTGGADFTGTKITCKNPYSKCAPVAVFGGHGCADIPKDRGYCDHLEHQLLPVNRWGTNYAVVKTKPRTYARDFVRVVAANDETNVSIKIRDEEYRNGTEKTVTLNAGQFFEYELNYIDDGGSWFTSGTSFIHADKPVQVTQYLSGAEDISSDCRDNSPGSSHTYCFGDPAMTIIPPVEQFRNEYYFFAYSVENTDTDGGNENYVEVITDPGVEILLDGETPTPAMDGEMQGAVFGSDKVYYIFELDSWFMRHHLSCSGACGILVYGWGMDVSYMYPGGLDLKVLK